MKVCNVCGEEFGGKDGENRCKSCDGASVKAKAAKAAARRAREAAMRACGMVKVRGALGGTYWE